MTQTTKMIEIFDLDGEVLDFVQSRVRELCAEKHDFSFEGSNHTCVCDNKEPHIPHVESTYDTQYFGELETFCCGKEGTTPEGDLIIVVENKYEGSATSPSDARGFWFIKPVEVA